MSFETEHLKVLSKFTPVQDWDPRHSVSGKRCGLGEREQRSRETEKSKMRKTDLSSQRGLVLRILSKTNLIILDTHAPQT